MALDENVPTDTVAGPLGGADRDREHRYRPLGSTAVRYVVRPTFRLHHALVRDLSGDGLAIITGGPLEVGAVLALQMRFDGSVWSSTAVAEVRHSARLPEGGWLTGCRFVDLPIPA